MLSKMTYYPGVMSLHGRVETAGETDRRAFLLAAGAPLVSLVFVRGAWSQEKTDTRTLGQKISDFLSLRLTREVIDDYILTPIASALKKTNQSADAVMPLYNIVEMNAINYGHLSAKLEFLANVRTPKLKETAAREVADVAKNVNDGLHRLRDTVLSIGAGAIAKFDPEVARDIKKYAVSPGTPADIERFLLQGSPQEIAQIAKDCKSAMVKVSEASETFLCRLACLYNWTRPQNCKNCEN